MLIKWMRVFSILAISLSVLGGIVLARQALAQQPPADKAPAQALTQDRYTLKIPDGLAFSDFRGYDTWQDVAPSATEGSIKSILANPTSVLRSPGTHNNRQDTTLAVPKKAEYLGVLTPEAAK